MFQNSVTFNQVFMKKKKKKKKISYKQNCLIGS